MGLPIAIGGKALSSREIAPPEPIPEDAPNAKVLEGVAVDIPPRVVTAVCDDQQLCAVCCISYYNMMNNGKSVKLVAEVRVQISPLSQAFSSKYRNILHRISFPPTECGGENENNNDETTIPLSPQLTFSSDGRNLACLVPHPFLKRSMVVCFQLRKPRTPPPAVSLPRPSYLNNTSNTTPLIRVATNPVTAKLPNDTELLNASSICNVKTQTSGSLLLAACVDGSIVVIAYRPAVVAGILHSPNSNDGDGGENEDENGSDECITCISHYTSPSRNKASADQGSRGKLVALYSSKAVLFSSHLIISSEENQMLMQLQLEREIPGSFMKATWMGPSFLALLTLPKLHDNTACQVWPIDEFDDTNDSIDTANTQSQATLEPVTTLVMSKERLNEYAHGSFSLESAATQSNSSSVPSNLQMEQCFSAMVLPYDASSNCLAVSSFVVSPSLSSNDNVTTTTMTARPFSCCWHWRTNVVGLILKCSSRHLLMERDGARVWQIPIYSQFYFARDFNGGSWLIHLLSDSARDWKSHFQNRIRKEVYEMALLSPSNSLADVSFGCREPSSLMISQKCVTYPTVSSPFSNQDKEFVWKDARIPASYTTAFGTPLIACIGQERSRSIAVASSKGTCVLDCSSKRLSIPSEFAANLKKGAAEAVSGDDGTKGARIEQPRWRLFGTEADERTFRVLAMTWWEGNAERKSGADSVQCDDLLVAVVAVQPKVDGEDGKESKKDETLYLACWNPRRLDQANQMMVRWRISSKSKTSSSWGVRLLPGFMPTTISLLSEPPFTDANGSGDDMSMNRRAVILLGDERDATNGENEHVNYQLFQLEVDSDGSKYPDSDETKYMVKAKLCSEGNLFGSEASPAPVSGLFLASASFDFAKVKPKSSRTLTVDNVYSNDTATKSFLAAVGIVRSPCKGLEAVLISTAGIDNRKEVVSPSKDAFLSKSTSEVSSYWHSHTIPFNPLLMDKNKPVESFFVWSIELCDGTLVCWSVPYIHGSLPKSAIIQSADVTEHHSNASNGVASPQASMDDKGENKLHQSLFGTVTSIGDSSSWIQETSVANRTGYALACVPSSDFGCMLRSSQSGKDLHRFAPVENEDHGSAKNLDHEIFCLASTELAPPALVPSLYSSLVGRVEMVGSDPLDSHVSYMMDFSSNTLNAFTMLKSVGNQDTVLVTLRTLIIRIIELIARESDKMGNDISAQHSLFLLTTTFADICEAAKERLPPMQFVALFLGIGRQIEPGFLVHLFPLPLSTPMPGDGQHKCRSVEDLFQYSIRHGSISIASSALPLFSSKRHSLKMCGSLIRHCLETFEENSDNPMSVVFDMSAEERRMLRGIFHFGVRIEDSGTMPPMEPIDEFDPLNIYQSSGDNSMDATDQSIHSSMSMDTPTGRRGSLLAAQKSSSKRVNEICQMFSASSLLGQFQRPKEEEAIFDAASSFILSGFDEVKIGFESPSASKSVSSRRTGDGSVSSESGEITMAGIIASFLLPLAFPTEASKQKFRWKRTATLAQVLLGHEQTHNDLDTVKLREMTRLAESWSLEEIIFSLQISNSSLNSDFSEKAKEKWLVRLLKRHLLECGMMMSTTHANLVLRLVMTLLDRYSLGRDIKARSPGLLLLGIVVAHCAGYQRELLDARPRNKFTTSYATALNEIRSR